ncbi:Uncharacterised protein [Burkholderia pseudomallei]|nr:Uncharacterised protein [Burkholderia pseudomallei]CAJ6705797.1 Uncharacterised protein [Burkholderia pseudomallei]
METIKAEDIKGGDAIVVGGSNYRIQNVEHGAVEILVHTTQRAWGEAFDTVTLSFNRGENVRLAEKSLPQKAKDMPEDQLESAVELLKALKRDLMHARRFGPDTLANYRRACSSAEGEVEEWLIKHGHMKSTA